MDVLSFTQITIDDPEYSFIAESLNMVSAKNPKKNEVVEVEAEVVEPEPWDCSFNMAVMFGIGVLAGILLVEILLKRLFA